MIFVSDYAIISHVRGIRFRDYKVNREKKLLQPYPPNSLRMFPEYWVSPLLCTNGRPTSIRIKKPTSTRIKNRMNSYEE